MNLPSSQKIRLRAAANVWISENFPIHRKYLAAYLTSSPAKKSSARMVWSVAISTKGVNGHSTVLGHLLVRDDAKIVEFDSPKTIAKQLDKLQTRENRPSKGVTRLACQNYEFYLGDGVKKSRELRDGQIDLLLTDPPYGISKPYTCERQIPRRLRKDGTDFIMPKGNFGEWDSPIEPKDWLEAMLPKVGGWFVTFCAQAQIGEYTQHLEAHKFVAVGTMVWQKTNPVPFNHKFKPINAWEAVVIGKRPGTKFNGRVVHNVFLYKSPSPQQRIHTTQKPLGLIEEFVELFSSKGDFVYDPFGGSGTTLIAASRLGRKALSYEKDPSIYKAACARVSEFSGRES